MEPMPDYFPEMLLDYLHTNDDQEMFDTLMECGLNDCWKLWQVSRQKVEADLTNRPPE